VAVLPDNDKLFRLPFDVPLKAKAIISPIK